MHPERYSMRFAKRLERRSSASTCHSFGIYGRLLWRKAEIEQREIIHGEPMTAPPACRLLAVTRRVAPGVRERAYIFAREGTGSDANEVAARKLFEASASIWGIEESELQSWQ